jgi:pyruvate dehydrogenase phosphatase
LWLNLSAHVIAIGNFSFKFHLIQLFSRLPSTASRYFIPRVTKHSQISSYIISKPSLRYVYLKPFRNCHAILILFTDGVDNLVSGRFVFQAVPRKGEPSAVVGSLLGGKVGLHVEGILGHGIEPKWRVCDGNRAIEVLGNLLGGTDIRRLSTTMNPEILSDIDDAKFYTDDTSMIDWVIFKAAMSP